MLLSALFRPLLESQDVNDADHGEALEQTGFWGRAGAGCLFMARSTGRFLVNHRSHHVEQPGTWGTWGGAIDRSEDPVAAVKREAYEETGYHGAVEIEPLYVFVKGTFRYSNFLLVVDDEFKPDIPEEHQWETQGWRWCDYGQWPSPLHFGLVSLLDDTKSAEIMRRRSSGADILGGDA